MLFSCEREWFVAAIPGPASTVVQAKEALKPLAVREAQARNDLNIRQARTGYNAAFHRQGEWFFVPVDRPLVLGPKLILRQEPLTRGGGSKPHHVEQLCRTGGEIVYVHSEHPAGPTRQQSEDMLRRRPVAKQWKWREMRRNPAVCARG
ncbi:MAG: hypothetical protein ACKV19_06255, partial [Verrucomicrobiales bacterium]